MRSSRTFDALVLVWAITMGTLAFTEGRANHWQWQHRNASLVEDVVVPPTCETCKNVEPDSYLAWLCWLLGC